jgi:hypothetical protein
MVSGRRFPIKDGHSRAADAGIAPRASAPVLLCEDC